MDRFLCVALCLVVILISLFALNRCSEAAIQLDMETVAVERTEPITEPTTTETAVTEPPMTSQPTEPTVTLYDVPLAEDLQLHIIRLCEKHHIDPAIVMAMIWRESTYRTDAIGDGGDSYGLMQVQPKWHSGRMEKLECTDLLDPYQNVTVGIDYLAENFERYGSIAKALVAYNQGFYKGTVTKYAESILAYAEEIQYKKG